MIPMIPMDPASAAGALRGAELRRSAARFRRAREFRRDRPPPLLRLYARLWWASRPRAGAWGPVPPSRAARAT